MPAPRISLICVGSELLRGKINTHASTLARRLSGLGLELAEEHTISDDLGALTQAISRAITTQDVVIVTGGLGPTFDDLTREAAAAACGRKLALSQPLLSEIRRKFSRARLKAMPPANARQAYLIEGAQPIANPVGTAPGQWLRLRGVRTSLLILLPGPPSELIPMLNDFVIPHVRQHYATGAHAEAHLHFVNVPESLVDQQVRPIIAREKGANFTILAQPGLVDLDIFTSGATRSAAERQLNRLVRAVRSRTGTAFYGMNENYPLEQVILKGFVRAKQTLALAESCTGGAIAKLLTDCAGSSAYFVGGVTSYHNRVKAGVVGVPSALLKKHGAVSAPVALAMADGVRQKMGSTWALSVTGIAGPGGGTPLKPVGLVYMALVGPSVRRTFKFNLTGGRARIRFRAGVHALDLLRRIHREKSA